MVVAVVADEVGEGDGDALHFFDSGGNGDGPGLVFGGGILCDGAVALADDDVLSVALCVGVCEVEAGEGELVNGAEPEGDVVDAAEAGAVGGGELAGDGYA